MRHGTLGQQSDGNFSSCIQVLIALLSFFGRGIVGAEVLVPRVWARQFVSDCRACSTTGLTRRSSADARERHYGTPRTGHRAPGELVEAPPVCIGSAREGSSDGCPRLR